MRPALSVAQICERKAEQRESYQSECGGSFHGIAPFDVPGAQNAESLQSGKKVSLIV